MSNIEEAEERKSVNIILQHRHTVQTNKHQYMHTKTLIHIPLAYIQARLFTHLCCTMLACTVQRPH